MSTRQGWWQAARANPARRLLPGGSAQRETEDAHFRGCPRSDRARPAAFPNSGTHPTTSALLCPPKGSEGWGPRSGTLVPRHPELLNARSQVHSSPTDPYPVPGLSPGKALKAGRQAPLTGPSSGRCPQPSQRGPGPGPCSALARPAFASICRAGSSEAPGVDSGACQGERKAERGQHARAFEAVQVPPSTPWEATCGSRHGPVLLPTRGRVAWAEGV